MAGHVWGWAPCPSARQPRPSGSSRGRQGLQAAAGLCLAFCSSRGWAFNCFLIGAAVRTSPRPSPFTWQLAPSEVPGAGGVSTGCRRSVLVTGRNEQRGKAEGQRASDRPNSQKKVFISTKVTASGDGSSSSRQHTGLGMQVAMLWGPAHPPEDKSPQNHDWGPTAQRLDSCLKSYNILGTVKQQMVTTFGLTQDKTPRAIPRPPAPLCTHPWRVPAPHQNYQRRLEPLRNCCFINLPTLPVWGTPPARRCSTACTPSTLLEGSEHGTMQMGQHGWTAPVPSCWGALFAFRMD